MGQAKNRKLKAKEASAALAEIERSMVASAVVKTMQAITELQGADCLGYAVVGAGLLCELGVPARAVAGHATWRVGPGDGDLVSHDPAEYATSVFKPAGKALMFHAWIEVDTPAGVEVVDFTTFQLRDKARALDALDGGLTQVDFCPDFIWQLPPAEVRSARAVAQAPSAGVFIYRRERSIEPMIFSHVASKELDAAVSAASFVYKKLRHQEGVIVVGVDREYENPGAKLSDPPQLRDHVEQARAAARAEIKKPARGP